MIYFYAYLGIGLLVLGLLYLVRETPEERAQNPMSFFSDGANGAYRTILDQLLDSVLSPALALSFIVISWPFMGYYRVKELVAKKNGTESAQDPVFAVEPAHLLERLAVEEVEARETVFDPLGAAPNLPFGHLHAAWRAFVDGLAEGDELWSFSADWQTGWGNMERRAGYVLVREGEPGEHFLTVWKGLPQETDAVGGASAGIVKYISGWLRTNVD